MVAEEEYGYRRVDSAHASGRLFDLLKREFGESELFFDVQHTGYGIDFRKEIVRALEDTKVFIAVVGDRWLRECDRLSGSHPLRFLEWGREEDFALAEIELASEARHPDHTGSCRWHDDAERKEAPRFHLGAVLPQRYASACRAGFPAGR